MTAAAWPTEAISLTPIRLAWLQRLADNGPTGLGEMPTTANGSTVGEKTWGPLHAAGFITRPDAVTFEITSVGRSVLAKASRCLA